MLINPMEVSLRSSQPLSWSGFLYFMEPNGSLFRSEWQRGLRHELSSLAQPLGSWVRVSLNAWMSVCVYSVFVLPCV
jgi:hypothetical protein